jgi:pentose-5-phosphate-3-epimerase
MPFLPSLLEYTNLDLDQKLTKIKNNQKNFLELQKSPDKKLYLHLDFVLPEFAKNRNVKPSNLESVVFELLEKYFGESDLYLSIHLMGTKNDLDFSFDFLLEKLSSLVFENENWTGEIFVPETEFVGFLDIQEYTNFRIGTWFDLGKYSPNSQFENQQSYLLMTVLAGKSGQKLSTQTKTQTLQIVNQNPKSNFTLDGGWGLSQELPANLSIVSYSTFWQEFDKVAKIM